MKWGWFLSLRISLSHFFWCIMLVFHIHSTSEILFLEALYPEDSHQVKHMQGCYRWKRPIRSFPWSLGRHVGSHSHLHVTPCDFLALCLIMFYTMKNGMWSSGEKCWFWDSLRRALRGDLVHVTLSATDHRMSCHTQRPHRCWYCWAFLTWQLKLTPKAAPILTSAK